MANTSPNLSLSPKDILHQVKLSCQLPSVIEAIARRKAIINAATAAGIQVDVAELQQAADTFRQEYRLQSSEDAWQWMQAHGLSQNVTA